MGQGHQDQKDRPLRQSRLVVAVASSHFHGQSLSRPSHCQETFQSQREFRFHLHEASYLGAYLSQVLQNRRQSDQTDVQYHYNQAEGSSLNCSVWNQRKAVVKPEWSLLSLSRRTKRPVAAI